MSESVEQWISQQQKIVEVSGRHAESLKLYGPDDAVWGQWPIDAEQLPEQVETLIVQLSEQLPRGKAKGQLVVYDTRGDQWSAFPIVFHGRSANASTAAQEAKTLQSASSIAIANLETVILTQANQIERLSEQNESHLEDIAKLVEIVMGYQTENTEVNLLIQEHERKQNRLDDMVKAASPAIGMLSQMLGQNIMAKAIEAQKKVQNAQQPRKEESSNGAPHDSTLQPQGPKAASAASDSHNGSNGSNGASSGNKTRHVRARKTSKRAAPKGRVKASTKRRVRPDVASDEV